METKRILTGVRPTGRLHLGHLLGMLRPLVELQGEYEMFVEVADYHALTTHFRHPADVQRLSREVALDFLAAGLDPDRCTIFVQSRIPEHAEMSLLFSMFTPVSRLERNPTYREKKDELGLGDGSLGLLGYPVLQAADILMYRANRVPVGEDQLPHLELTREIARRFNTLYGETLPEPQPIISTAPRLMGLDGARKMSKSLGNQIDLAHTPEEIRERVATMVTDPARAYRSDPGHPEACNVHSFFRAFSPVEAPEVAVSCRSASVGCVACKKRLAEILVDALETHREARGRYESRPKEVREILEAGAYRARREAGNTMTVVRRLLGLAPAPAVELSDAILGC